MFSATVRTLTIRHCPHYSTSRRYLRCKLSERFRAIFRAISQTVRKFRARAPVRVNFSEIVDHSTSKHCSSVHASIFRLERLVFEIRQIETEPLYILTLSRRTRRLSVRTSTLVRRCFVTTYPRSQTSTFRPLAFVVVRFRRTVVRVRFGRGHGRIWTVKRQNTG